MKLLRCRILVERIRCAMARRLGGEPDLINSATDVDELHPEETISGPPCIALPGQYERVRGAAFGISVAEEISQLKGAPRKVGPTRRYLFEDVLVSNGIIYGRGRRKLFNYTIHPKLSNVAPTEYDTVALRSSFIGCHFFGHWLRDDCATHLLAEQSGTPMSMPTPSWPDRSGYLALFEQSCKELDRAHVERLELFDDIYQNAHKARRLRALRARIAKSQKSHSVGRITYLARGPGGKQRTLINESEIIEALSRRGVIVVQPEKQSVRELIRDLFGARIVISIEGSQLSHALYTLSDEGGMIVIQPPDRFFNSHMDWARALNMKYAIVVGEQHDLGFRLPVDDLLRTLDLLDATLT
jgi:Glycosyltransferase 61